MRTVVLKMYVAPIHTVKCVDWGVWIFVLLAVGVGGCDVVVEFHALDGCAVPCELAEFEVGVLAKLGGEWWADDDVDDAVGDCVGIPEVDFECVTYDFGYA